MATKVQLTEERARELAQQADLRVRTNLEFKKENGEPQKPTQARMLRLATAPTEKQLAESQRKADKERLKAMPKDERKVAKARIDWSKRLEEQEEAKRKLEKAKRDLEAAKEKNDPKAIK
ncbi:MAG: hypothetical protein J6W96_05690, partial [Alphaproteobacteria bacterium]|nr:hypothetical protein [Alphaproteobacteria bacterium]